MDSPLYSPRKYDVWFSYIFSLNIITENPVYFDSIVLAQKWVMGRPCFLSLTVFGQRLDEAVAYEQRLGPTWCYLVEKCASSWRHGLNEEGIFRLPGQITW